jgi:hypothetical protein
MKIAYNILVGSPVEIDTDEEVILWRVQRRAFTHESEQSGSWKGGESFDQASDYQILKQNSALFNTFMFICFSYGGIFIWAAVNYLKPRSVLIRWPFSSLNEWKRLEFPLSILRRSFLIYSIMSSSLAKQPFLSHSLPWKILPSWIRLSDFHFFGFLNNNFSFIARSSTLCPTSNLEGQAPVPQGQGSPVTPAGTGFSFRRFRRFAGLQ